MYPTDDLRRHNTDGAKCWCRPTVEGNGEDAIIVHNAMDQRELYETGARKPS